jgi:hypothetical protein
MELGQARCAPAEISSKVVADHRCRVRVAEGRRTRRYDVISPQALCLGKYTVEFGLHACVTQAGISRRRRLSINGTQVAQGRVDEQVPMRCGTETMDIGMDCVSPVCSDYEKKGLFPFTGTIESVTFAFGAHAQPTGMERLELTTKMDQHSDIEPV